MDFLKDDKGQKSLMRLITLLIISAGLLWGFIEIIAYLVFKKYGIDFDIHETLILTTLSIGVTGKGAQKAIESIQNKSE
jgi:hypothetical protein